MSKPFVTALIDTYNHESFIEDAINSVVEQDFPASDMQVLVVDDGSTDRTPELVRKFGPRVRLLRKVNEGQASAFNAGVAEAKGEIVAFLDGDDRWAPNKVRRVAEVFATHREVGIVGHSITELLFQGGHRIERVREDSRFQASSPEGARIFRTRKNFLGTSRMTIRTPLLKRILPVPARLVIQADEYLFTLASVLSQAVVLSEPLTFYRHHSSNFFQISVHDPVKLRRKLDVFQTLTAELSEQLRRLGTHPSARKKIVGAIELEATQMRLILDGGYPWETVSTELKTMFVFYPDASFWQHLLTCARLVPGIFMPPRAYYRYRQRLSHSAFYQAFRKKFLPFPVPRHVDRQEKRAL